MSTMGRRIVFEIRCLGTTQEERYKAGCLEADILPFPDERNVEHCLRCPLHNVTHTARWYRKHPARDLPTTDDWEE